VEAAKNLKLQLQGPLMRNRIVLLGVFGLLQEACTPKTNALQFVE
jgi:hypothetical protein